MNAVDRFGYAEAIKDTHRPLFKFAKQDLKFNGVSEDIISQLLGHSDPL